MPAYRIIAEGRGTLQEIEEHYSIEDIYDVCDILDMMALQTGGA